jgi:hypothetical protein
MGRNRSAIRSPSRIRMPMVITPTVDRFRARKSVTARSTVLEDDIGEPKRGDSQDSYQKTTGTILQQHQDGTRHTAHHTLQTDAPG